MNKTDFTKLYKELYAPKSAPSTIEVPSMQFLMVDGHGNPNDSGGEYQKAVELLYALSYTIKMKCINYSDPNTFDYVVLPLEGLWWLEDSMDRDFTQKDLYCWTSMIRQPDFVTKEHFEQAKQLVAIKKPELDITKARLETYTEGLCLQCMHIGPYDTEPATIAAMDAYLTLIGKVNAMDTLSVEGKTRRHHEIYLSNPMKTKPESRKTILRHPIA
ncbi:MAG: hypothetical protein K0R34_1183 [Herbinix sp.]|jgi:hypothetical protein|nr:hypothetical protein [Herbinix sp.]